MAAPVLGGLLVADEVIDLLLPVLFYHVRARRWRKLHAEEADKTVAGGLAAGVPTFRFTTLRHRAIRIRVQPANCRVCSVHSIVNTAMRLPAGDLAVRDDDDLPAGEAPAHVVRVFVEQLSTTLWSSTSKILLPATVALRPSPERSDPKRPTEKTTDKWPALTSSASPEGRPPQAPHLQSASLGHSGRKVKFGTVPQRTAIPIVPAGRNAHTRRAQVLCPPVSAAQHATSHVAGQ